MNLNYNEKSILNTKSADKKSKVSIPGQNDT